MSKHTPGPWVVAENDGAYVKNNSLAPIRIEERSTEYEMVLALITKDCPLLEQQADANALLIALAPELLEELIDAREALIGALRSIPVGDPESDPAVMSIDATLAKLEGGAA
jgi:hypothetical protein